MINIVVAAHGDLAAGLLMAAEMIAGSQEGLCAVSLLPDESPESFGAKLADALQPIEGQDTLILVDLFGGTPYNVAARQVLKPNVECVTGANLPMLLEALMARDEAALDALAVMATEAGQQSARNLKPLLQRVR